MVSQAGWNSDDERGRDPACGAGPRIAGATSITTRWNTPLWRHTWRGAGAVYFSSIVLDLYKLKQLTRWASDLILHHERMAPLKSLTNEFKRWHHDDQTCTMEQINALEANMKQAFPDAQTPRHPNELKAIERQILSLATKFNEQHMALKNELRDQMKALEIKARPREFVVNRKTPVTHQALSRFDDAGPQAMADCGFKYVFADINMLKGHDDEGEFS